MAETTLMQPVDFDPFADPTAATLPLTEPQHEMHSAVQMGAEASCAYNQCFVLRLRGPLSLESLGRAMAQVVERHQALRLRIVGDGEAQEIVASVDTTMPLTDLTGSADAARRDAIDRLIEHETHTQFDLGVAPLWRVRVVREGEGSHRLIFTAHHLVCDGWSSAVVFGDLAAAYAADRFGLPAKLPRAASYREYVESCESAAAVAEARTCEEYWAKQYADGVPSFELPTDRPRPHLKTYSAAREVLEIDERLYLAVRKAGAQHGCTLFVTLLAAFEALLARLSGSTELVVGVPMASQALLDNGHLVAHGVNTVPLLCRVALDGSFADHLQRVRGSFLDAQAHQRLTFGSLVKRLKVPRDPSRTPLVNVTFNIDRLGAPFDFGELALEGVDAPKAFVNFELMVNAVDSGSTLCLECDYNADLYSPSTVKRWLHHYRQLLDAAAADATIRVDALPLLSPAERSALTIGAGARQAFPSGTTLHARFEQQVERTPAATALVAFAGDGQRVELSYAELNRRANVVAHELRALGVVADQLVGLRTERNAEMVVGLLAILKAGCAYLPLDPVYPKERVAFMLEDSHASVVLTQTSLKADLADARVRLVCLDEPRDAGGDAGANPSTAGGPDDLAYVIYTSGSTGKPKGVRITHHNVARLFAATEAWFGFDRNDVWTLFHSYAFDFSVWELWGALLYGGRVVVVPLEGGRSADDFHELLVRERVTVLNQTPSAFRSLIEAGARSPDTPLALRYVIFGGEALELQSLRPWFERHGDAHPRLINMYGITETTVHVTYRPITLADLDSGAGSVIGVPLPDLRVYILDARGEPVPIGVAGEMFVAGAGVGLGYLNRPDLSGERFVRDPFDPDLSARAYRSGDLARRLDGGDIEYLGRIDQQVKIRGFRIELGEIEAAISQHPQVRHVAVIAREDVAGDKRLVAYVVAAAEGSQLAQQLRQDLRAALPEYMVPAHVVLLPALPLTANGKLDRAALPPPAEASSASRAVEIALPTTAAEIAVAEIWCRLLALDEVSVTDNFFDLGGHSLLATRAVAEMNKRLGTRVAFRRMMFESLGQLAQADAASGSETRPPPRSGRVGRWLGSLIPASRGKQ